MPKNQLLTFFYYNYFLVSVYTYQNRIYLCFIKLIPNKMKQMTKKSAEKKLEALSLNKTSIVYKLIREVIEGTRSIRPCYSTGSGRWNRNQDCTVLLDIAFRKIGIEYLMSNDSPRGGATGKLITIVTKIK